MCLQVEKYLSGRLEAGLKSWTECLKGSRSSRHMTMDDSDTSMMAHKPGGDPDIQVIIRLTYYVTTLYTTFYLRQHDRVVSMSDA